MLPGVPGSATCVQKFDDSLNSAIHITYRISLRSSSLREPRYPSLKVVKCFFVFASTHTHSNKEVNVKSMQFESVEWFKGFFDLIELLKVSPLIEQFA